jgi:hypothetical protein
VTQQNKSRSILHMVAAAGVVVGTGLGATAVNAAVGGSDVANALPAAKARPGIHLAACAPCNPCAAKACAPCNPCAAKGCAPANPCAAKGCAPANPCKAK